MTASINMTDMKQVSMEIAITMEAHAALSTTTKAKAEYIEGVLERAVQAAVAKAVEAEREACARIADADGWEPECCRDVRNASAAAIRSRGVAG